MIDAAPVLTTSRLRLVPATPATVSAELEDRHRLAEVLEAALPADWPPAHHDLDTLRFWRDALSQPGAAGWWLHYVVLMDPAHPTLVGSVGYKGPPSNGVVEIGYSIVPSWQRRGLASEACRALVESSWERGADVVVAHTLSRLEPSIGVLHKLGFEPSEPPEPGVLAFTLRRG
jgi:RimJ/RimL family protein N-acetyltransferase